MQHPRRSDLIVCACLYDSVMDPYEINRIGLIGLFNFGHGCVPLPAYITCKQMRKERTNKQIFVTMTHVNICPTSETLSTRTSFVKRS